MPLSLLSACHSLLMTASDSFYSWFGAQERGAQARLALVVVLLGLSSRLRWTFILLSGMLWGSVALLPPENIGVMPLELNIFQIKIIFYVLLTTQIYRIVESKYGPRMIPDVKRDYSDLAYFRGQMIRKSRQLFEIIIYTLLPAFLWSKVLLHEEDEWSGPYRLPWFICISFFCGIVQLVCGTNPSHKPTILDQYGDAVPRARGRTWSGSSGRDRNSNNCNNSYNSNNNVNCGDDDNNNSSSSGNNDDKSSNMSSIGSSSIDNKRCQKKDNAIKAS